MFLFYPYLRKSAAFLLAVLFTLSAKAQIPAAAYSFSASAKTYTPLAGGNVINFTTYPDDVTVTNIPIGFSFTFCGVDYNQVSACTNGWISFANTSTTSLSNSASGGINPGLFPLWDDESGFGGVASYLTTGAPGNRVFTIEWANWSWMYKTSTPYPDVISYQVKLYESNNRIEFLYSQGPNAINNTPSASIGIIRTTTDYQALNNSGVSPTSSTTTFTTGINTKPATGQSYVWDPPPPCPQVVPIALGGYNSTAASFHWNAAGGAVSYEYAVDKNADRPPLTATTVNTTTGTIGSITGLTPSTVYYIHVRSKCSAYSISKWDTLSFKTFDACDMPKRINILTIDSNSVSFQWPVVGTATKYQYFIDSLKGTPTSAAGAVNTTTPYVSLSNLKEGTVYNIHYRSLCPGNDSSAWALDSFRIPIPCRRPLLALSSLTANRAVAYWNSVNTAIGYEYFFGEPSAPPAFGTPTGKTSILLPGLTPNKPYDLHVRCSCEYYGIHTISDWSTLEFTTLPPLQINTANPDDKTLSVYPNPVKNELHVNISGNLGKNAEITVNDLKGQVIKRMEVTGNSITIDTHEMAPGVYFLRYNDDGTNKIIKISKE